MKVQPKNFLDLEDKILALLRFTEDNKLLDSFIALKILLEKNTSNNKEREKCNVAYQLMEIHKIVINKIDELSKDNISSIELIEKYKEILNFFSSSMNPGFFKACLKKINWVSTRAEARVFLNLAAEIIGINKVEAKDKIKQINVLMPKNANLLTQLETIIELQYKDSIHYYKLSEHLEKVKVYVDTLKESVAIGVSQSTFRTVRELANDLEPLFKLTSENNLTGISAIFKRLAQVDNTQKGFSRFMCFSTNRLCNSQLSFLAKSILEEQGIFEEKSVTYSSAESFLDDSKLLPAGYR